MRSVATEVPAWRPCRTELFSYEPPPPHLIAANPDEMGKQSSSHLVALVDGKKLMRYSFGDQIHEFFNDE